MRRDVGCTGMFQALHKEIVLETEFLRPTKGIRGHGMEHRRVYPPPFYALL